MSPAPPSPIFDGSSPTTAGGKTELDAIVARLQDSPTGDSVKGDCDPKLLALDICEVLVAVLRANVKDPDILTVALRALQHLAAASACKGPQKVSNAGAVSEAVAAMMNHESNLLLQQVGCHLIELVAFAGPKLRAKTIKEGGVDAATKALKMHKSAAAVQSAALAALQAMGEEGIDCSRRFAECDGVGALVLSLTEHKNDPQVMYWGRLLFRTLSASDTELRSQVQNKMHWQGVDLNLEE
eukprot:CAMPEP_0206601224 /NCGR_PEP_ID=MMETSP0325_2-20121206/46464_1 /ASSEMBLY_ACC=CAM_ASM_000347 /TAXON_ID=2866 /ORGANISM="Crypthecodinium cohnii, Strain Seligo" /LENGTH=240 /DNA_ID=CAMNT_0054113079 /DNA_START=76 /DNA_END=798 /DNA_ORIENTATION=+